MPHTSGKQPEEREQAPRRQRSWLREPGPAAPRGPEAASSEAAPRPAGSAAAGDGVSAETALRRYAELFEASAQPLLVTDAGGAVRECNPAAALLLGRHAADVQGESLADLLGGALRGLPAHGGPVTFETELEAAGAAVPVEVTRRPLSGDDGAVLWLLHDLRPAHAAVRTERRLLQEKAARAASQEAARQATFLAEAARTLSRVLRFDEVAATVAELAVPMLADFCVVDVVDPDLYVRRIAAVHRDPELADVMDHLRRSQPEPATGSPFARVMAGGEPEVITEPGPEDLQGFGRRDLLVLKRLHAAELLVLPLRARGGVVGTMTLGRSGADRRLAPQLLFAQAYADRAAFALDNARLYADALQASEAKSEFIGMISHEFRTPLTAIVGFSELLESGTAGGLTAKQKEYAERVRLAAWHMSQLVEEVLAFARLEAGRLEVQLAEIDVCDVVRNAVGVLRTSAETKGLALVLDMPEAVPAVSDAGKLRQILMNLVGNAVKFTREGGVELRVRRQDDAIRITVTDTGPGIPAADRERVFERFWQGERVGGGGAGIGLAVVRGLARLLGGEVALDSQPGKGSTFIVTLPVAGPPPAARDRRPG